MKFNNSREAFLFYLEHYEGILSPKSSFPSPHTGGSYEDFADLVRSIRLCAKRTGHYQLLYDYYTDKLDWHRMSYDKKYQLRLAVMDFEGMLNDGHKISNFTKWK